MRILIVDDNEPNRILAQSILEKEEHIVVTASSGEKALKECAGVKFDLIIMDILMPRMNGITTLKKLRQTDGRNSNTPVFALNSYSSDSDQRMYKQMGFEFVLPKPLRQRDVKHAWNIYQNNSVLQNTIPNNSKISEQSLIDLPQWKQIQTNASAEDLASITLKFWKNADLHISAINEHKEQASRAYIDSLSHLRKAAHALKGSAATLALRQLETISEKLQNAPPEDILSLADTISTCVEESRRAQITNLKKLISKRGS